MSETAETILLVIACLVGGALFVCAGCAVIAGIWFGMASLLGFVLGGFVGGFHYAYHLIVTL